MLYDQMSTCVSNTEETRWRLDPGSGSKSGGSEIYVLEVDTYELADGLDVEAENEGGVLMSLRLYNFRVITHKLYSI